MLNEDNRTLKLIHDFLGYCRTNLSVNSDEFNTLLKAIVYSIEDDKENKDELILHLLTVMLHIGDVNRTHNIHRQFKLSPESGGMAYRETFREIIKWFHNNQPDILYTEWFMYILIQFSGWKQPIYNEIRTDRKKGNLISEEYLLDILDTDKLANLYAKFITKKKYANEASLIAKALPSVKTGKKTYRAGKSNTAKHSLRKRKLNNEFIYKLRMELNWSIKDYKEFRKKQNTIEQLLCSKNLLSLSKKEFYSLVDGLPSLAKVRLSNVILDYNKTTKVKNPNPKWDKLGNWLLEHEDKQSDIALAIRNTDNKEEKAELAKQLKTKSTNIKTIDMLAMMLNNSSTKQEIDNIYQDFLNKNPMDVKVFPVLDNSGSMSAPISGYIKDINLARKYLGITMSQIARLITIYFSTQSPSMFRNTYSIFSSTFKVFGTSFEVDKSRNRFMNEGKKKTKQTQILSEKKTLSENLISIDRYTPNPVYDTNIGSAIQFFVSKLKEGVDMEELPEVLLFITDNEWNTGMSPKQFMKYANDNGYYPLVILWSLEDKLRGDWNNIPNCLTIGGFSEVVLNQIVRNIKSGVILPQTEILALRDDSRYNAIINHYKPKILNKWKRKN